MEIIETFKNYFKNPQLYRLFRPSKIHFKIPNYGDFLGFLKLFKMSIYGDC